MGILPDDAVLEVLNQVLRQSSQIRAMRFTFFDSCQHLTEVSRKNPFQQSDLFTLGSQAEDRIDHFFRDLSVSVGACLFENRQGVTHTAVGELRNLCGGFR